MAKQSGSRAVVTAAAVKTAKLEANKKKRKRKVIPTSTNPTLGSKEVEEEDEATDDPLVVDNRAASKSPSLANKRQRDMEQHVTEEDLSRMREAQIAAAGAHVN
jgi:hypothetical protein